MTIVLQLARTGEIGRTGQLKVQDAFSPPSGVPRSPVSVSCLVSSSKLVFTSVRTWRATGASSCTAFSK
jgi:hypothetical protein